MFEAIAIIILKYRDKWRKFWKTVNPTYTSTHYRYTRGNSAGTSSTLDPEREKKMWETFDDSFKLMDESFKHMDDIFKDKNEKKSS